MTAIPQNLADQTDSSTTTKPSTSDWQQYHHKAKHIRLMAVLLKACIRLN